MVDLAMSIFEFLTKFLVFWNPWHPWVCIRSDLKPLFETNRSDSSYSVAIALKLSRARSWISAVRFSLGTQAGGRKVWGTESTGTQHRDTILKLFYILLVGIFTGSMGVNCNLDDIIEKKTKDSSKERISRIHWRCQDICFLQTVGPHTEYHDATTRSGQI